MSLPASQRYSLEEYFASEEASPTKHEYLAGQIYAMAGASPEHVLICSNIIASLHPLLRSKGCHALGSDLRIKVEATGLYTYADVVIVCGKRGLEGPAPQSLTNPAVIFEVLSPSTEAYDRGEKFEHYTSIESLREIILVTQDGVSVQHFARSDADHWTLSRFNSMDQVVDLSSLGASIAMKEIYEGVEFPTEPRRQSRHSG